jgi:hypothetical protein
LVSSASAEPRKYNRLDCSIGTDCTAWRPGYAAGGHAHAALLPGTSVAHAAMHVIMQRSRQGRASTSCRNRVDTCTKVGFLCGFESVRNLWPRPINAWSAALAEDDVLSDPPRPGCLAPKPLDQGAPRKWNKVHELWHGGRNGPCCIVLPVEEFKSPTVATTTSQSTPEEH